MRHTVLALVINPGIRLRVHNFVLTFKLFIMSERKKVITAHNYVRKGYVSHKPSLTVPGQVLPIRTVLDRFRRGQSVQSFNPVYNPDLPPGYESMDKIERIEAARAQSRTVARIRKALATQQAQQKESPAPEPPSSPEP